MMGLRVVDPDWGLAMGGAGSPRHLPPRTGDVSVGVMRPRSINPVTADKQKNNPGYYNMFR